MKKIFLVLIFLFLATPLKAQVVSTSKLIWDQPNVASSAEAAGFSFKYYPDGSATGAVLAGVTCSGTTTITCQASWPAFTPGNHTLTISATNTAGESVKSSPFAFVFVIIPSAPINIRIG